MTGVITINEGRCWICEKTESITMHHALPKHLKPAKNVIVPICHPCHDKLNTVDYVSIINYCYKILNMMSSSRNHIKQLAKKLEDIAKDDTTKETSKSI